MWKFLMPVFGAIESWMLMEGDSPNAFTVVGLVILTASLLIFYNRPLRTFFFGTGKNTCAEK